MFTRSNTIEFQHGFFETKLEITQDDDVIDESTVDKVNQLVTASVTQNAIQSVSTFIANLELEAAGLAVTSTAQMDLQLGDFAANFTVTCTVVKELAEPVLRSIIIKEIMPNVAAEVLGCFGTDLFGKSSIDSGYHEIVHRKVMERMFGGAPEDGPIPDSGFPMPFMPTGADGGDSVRSGMYL